LNYIYILIIPFIHLLICNVYYCLIFSLLIFCPGGNYPVFGGNVKRPTFDYKTCNNIVSILKVIRVRPKKSQVRYYFLFLPNATKLCDQIQWFNEIKIWVHVIIIVFFVIINKIYLWFTYSFENFNRFLIKSVEKSSSLQS